MLGRALTTATVTLLIGCSTAIPVRAENLEAGKSPSQIFAGACLVCHKGTRGLIRTVTPGSLPGFLRQHYTTSSDMAGLLSAYLLSNGAADTRLGGGSIKQGKDARVAEPKPAVAPEQAEPQPGRRHHRPGAPPQEAGKPDPEGLTAQGGPKAEPKGESKGESRGEPAVRTGRNARRLARPGSDTPETDKPAVGAAPAAAANEPGSNADLGVRPASAKRKLSKRGRPGREEPPDTDAAKTEPAKDEPSRGDAAKTETPGDASPKDEATKTGSTRPADTGNAEAGKTDGARPDAANGEAGRGDTLLRVDPVPVVTPAPKPSEVETRPSSPAASAASANSLESWSAGTQGAKPVSPSTEASAPHPAPTVPAGPPAPPISQ
jgi:hypothetical protein